MASNLIKTLVLKYDYGYDVFAFDAKANELLYYPNLTTFLNKMCHGHIDSYEVHTLCGDDLILGDIERPAYERLWHTIPDSMPQEIEDFFICYSSDLAYEGLVLDE